MKMLPTLCAGAIFTAMMQISCASGSHGATIRSVLNSGDFVPHIPSLKEVRNELGPYKELEFENGRLVCYSDTSSDNGLVLFLDDGAEEEFTAVREVAVFSVSSTRMQDCSPIRDYRIDDSFHQVKLGGLASQLTDLNVNYEVESQVLFGLNLKVYTFNPLTNQNDLYHRFYVYLDRIVGYGIGVTE